MFDHVTLRVTDLTDHLTLDLDGAEVGEELAQLLERIA